MGPTGPDGNSADIARHSQDISGSITRRSGRDVIHQDEPRSPTSQFETPPDEHLHQAQGSKWKRYFGPGGNLRPFRLLKQDAVNLKGRYLSDWTLFNQQVFASAVYIFFTNLLPGITFASDLYSLTGKSWGTIEIVFSTGLCGIIFATWVPVEESQMVEANKSAVCPLNP